MGNIYEASNQWATRPDDERFWNLDELYDATLKMKEEATQKNVKAIDVEFSVVGEEVVLNSKRTGMPHRISNWGFTQLSNLAGTPSSFLQSGKISPNTVALVLNETLSKREDEFKLLIQKNPKVENDFLIRAANGIDYGRVWAADIVLETARHTQGTGWRVPPGRPRSGSSEAARAATGQDVLAFRTMGLGIKVGDMIAPSGLYYGPSTGKDLFIFLVNEDRRLKGDENLCRFTMLWNSEVGASYFGGMSGFYDTVCGNHILWNTSNVFEFKIKHSGRDTQERAFFELSKRMKVISEESSERDSEMLNRAKRYILANSKDEVIDLLYSKDIASKKILKSAYEVAEITPRYGDPKSAWAMASGMTEISQLLPYADKRVDVDKAAGKVLRMAS